MAPHCFSLTRQVIPILNEIDLKLRREGVLRGGYIAKREKGKLDLIIMFLRQRTAARARGGE